MWTDAAREAAARARQAKKHGKVTTTKKLGKSPAYAGKKVTKKAKAIASMKGARKNAELIKGRATKTDTGKFSKAQLDRLRSEYSKIKTVNVDSPTYKKLINRMDSMKLPMLKQLAKANVPFISGLARNRIRIP